MDNDGVPVRITSDGIHGRTTTVEVAGVDVSRHCHSLTLRASVDTLTTLHLSMFAREGFSVILPAAVSMTVQPMEEGVMDVTTLTDGTLRYAFVRKAQE